MEESRRKDTLEGREISFGCKLKVKHRHHVYLWQRDHIHSPETHNSASPVCLLKQAPSFLLSTQEELTREKQWVKVHFLRGWFTGARDQLLLKLKQRPIEQSESDSGWFYSCCFSLHDFGYMRKTVAVFIYVIINKAINVGFWFSLLSLWNSTYHAFSSLHDVGCLGETIGRIKLSIWLSTKKSTLALDFLSNLYGIPLIMRPSLYMMWAVWVKQSAVLNDQCEYQQKNSTLAFDFLIFMKFH